MCQNKNPVTSAQNPDCLINAHALNTQTINVCSSWWQGGPTQTNPHMGQMFLPSAVPPVLPAHWQLALSPPPGHLAALLASSGLGCCWATMGLSQPAKVSDIWSSICDVTNSWLVIRPLWKGGSEGWMRRRPYFQQALSWNAECFRIELWRLQTEWLL